MDLDEEKQQKKLNEISLLYSSGILKNTLFDNETNPNYLVETTIQIYPKVCEDVGLPHIWYQDWNSYVHPGVYICIRCSIIDEFPEFEHEEWDKETKKKKGTDVNLKYIIYDGYAYFCKTYYALEGSLQLKDYELEFIKNFYITYKDTNKTKPNWILIRKKLKQVGYEHLVNYIPIIHKKRFPFDIIDVSYYYSEIAKYKRPNTRVMSANYIIWRSFVINGIKEEITNWVPLWYSEKTILKYNKIFDTMFMKK